MAKYEELEKSMEGTYGAMIHHQIRKGQREQQREIESIKSINSAIDRSKGASEARRKYELAKRDYAKASLLGKAYLKLTGQANFKKMLEEANKRSR